MKFTVAALALFCIVACANAGLGRGGGGPPRSTGPTFPRGGFRFRRDVEVDEPMQDRELTFEQDLKVDSVRNHVDVEEQPIPVIHRWYRLPRGVQLIEIEEEQY